MSKIRDYAPIAQKSLGNYTVKCRFGAYPYFRKPLAVVLGRSALYLPCFVRPVYSAPNLTPRNWHDF
jgi:hypothetical protein